MVLPIILGNKHVLKTDHPEELLQETVLYSEEIVLLVFESHYQLWNIKGNKLILKTEKNDRVFYFCQNIFISQFVVAFISYEHDKDVFLGIIDLKTNHISSLGNIQKDLNVTKLLSFANDQIVVFASGTTLLYKDKTLSKTNQWGNAIQPYNQNTYVAFSNTDVQKTSTIALVTSGTMIKHQIRFNKDCTILEINQYDKQRAIILTSVKDNNSTQTIIYNLSKNIIEESFPLKLKGQYLIKTNNNNWIACQTIEEDERSQLKVQQIRSGNNDVISKEFKPWQRISNKYYLSLIAYHAQNEITTTLQTEVVLKKESFIIHLLEQTGIIEEFGNEIVKQVINNLI